MKDLSDNYSFILILILLTITMFSPDALANPDVLQQQRFAEKVLEFIMTFNR